jgi:hypothetical protein
VFVEVTLIAKYKFGMDASVKRYLNSKDRQVGRSSELPRLERPSDSFIVGESPAVLDFASCIDPFERDATAGGALR